MKLRLSYNSKTNRYFIERKDGWFSSWERVYGMTKPLTGSDTGKPVEKLEGGWSYSDKEFALVCMNKIMYAYKEQEKLKKKFKKNYKKILKNIR